MFKQILEKFNKLMVFKSETFQAYKIKDTEQSIEVAELVVDAEVLISTPTGSELAPDGDYILDNGAEIKVAEGKILEVVKEATPEDAPVAEQEALATEEDKVEDAPEAKDDTKEAELLAEIESLKAEIEKLKEGFSAYPTKADLAKFQSELSEELKKLESIPTEFSKVDNRVEANDVNPLDKYIRMVERSKN